MLRVLFLHGFFASGQCVPAVALRKALAGKAEVMSPDLPLHPHEVLGMIREVIANEKPDILVGNSCGSFYAQMVAAETGLPALLGNPHFRMTEFLKERIGKHQYKAPRKNGNQNFVIDETLISEFEEMEAIQFDAWRPENKDLIWGLFGEKDTLAHFEPLFLKYYTHAFHFPGGHTPTAEETKKWYAPLVVERLVVSVSKTNDI